MILLPLPRGKATTCVSRICVQYPSPRWTTHLDSDIELHICVASHVCVWLLGYLQYFLLKNDWNILFVIGVWFFGEFFWCCLLFWCYLLVYIYCMLIFLVLFFCVGLLLVWLFFYFCVKVISLFVVLGRYFIAIYLRVNSLNAFFFVVIFCLLIVCMLFCLPVILSDFCWL